MLNRRSFIKLIAAAGGLLLPPISWLAQKTARANDMGSDHQVLLPLVSKGGEPVGELYGGFILLPDGIPIPDFVIPPQLNVPDVCGVGHEETDRSAKALTRQFTSLEQLHADLNKNIPVVSFEKLPEKLDTEQVTSLGYVSGESVIVTISYSSENESLLFLNAQLDFNRPFPVWFSNPIDDCLPVVYQKVDFLPNPGLMTIGQTATTYLWIKQDILYTLTVDSKLLGLEDPQVFFESLLING
jgi:hypothetical protein